MDVGTDLGAGCLMAWAIEGSGLSACSQRVFGPSVVINAGSLSAKGRALCPHPAKPVVTRC